MQYRSPEQAAYAKLIEGAVSPGLPLLAGAAAGLGKTHGYTIPLVASGRRVAIAMSTRQLMDQFLESDALKQALIFRPASVAALQPKGNFLTQGQYRAHREQALSAEILVITHAATLIDSLMPSYAELRTRDVLLFDEADLLADAADLRNTFRIDQEVLIDCKADTLPHLEAAKAVKEGADSIEDRAAASAIIYALENPAWYKAVGKDDNGALVLKHRMPGRMLKRLINEAPRCIFTSGTLQVSGRFDYFAQALGLSSYATESRHIDPGVHGLLDVAVASDEMSSHQMADQILSAERPTLVLTTSHAFSEELGGLCAGSTVRSQGEALADAVARCPDDGILIAAGAWSGLDAPRLRWKTVVIPKTPYLRPAILDARQVTRYLDSKVVALRRTNQGLHRGLRTPDAQCKLLLLDPRSSRPDLRDAIPARFRVAWEAFAEGSRIVRDHVAGETNRSNALRAAALKILGAKCSHEGCTVKEKHLLDVHHLKPVAQGARLTTLGDVVVLCKNHHAEAHHQMRLAEFRSTGDD
jgi:Rad3-related DNA helicase